MIKLIADSTCDLSDEILERYNITLVPLSITIEGKTYQDRVTIMPDDLFGIIEEIEGNITTANPSPEAFLTEMKKAVDDGYNEIICINMSSGTSGSYQSAKIGKELFYEEFPDSEIKIRVIDSVSMSHGTGWLLLKSARLLEKGATYEEITDFVETYKFNMKHFLSVDDLDHLIKSGRLTNASAFIGKLLKIKPIMSMKNKKGVIVAKERGRKRVLEHYVREFRERVDLNITDFVIIGYTSDRIIAENLMNKVLKETDYEGKIYIMQMGVAVGAHVGLGAISFYFIEKDHLKDGLMKNEIKQLKEKKDEMIKIISRYQNKK
ncbi:MAG: DegV family protein [Clostridiales bacterium]|nr:DegV family protein [Clostridiales bacterium]